MTTFRRGTEGGEATRGCQTPRHSVSFDQYYDPHFMGFRSLRVINEDWVQPGHGFPTHPHRDMEIITYLLEGSLEHKDSMGNGSIIRPGDGQRMSAGTGVRHSEANPYKTDAAHLVQIWILPERRGIEPGYEQKEFPAEEKRGKLRLIASPDGKDESVTIHQDAKLYVSLLLPGEQVEHKLSNGRYGSLQVAKGTVELNGKPLQQGDGAAISEEPKLEVKAPQEAKILLFDLA